MFEALDPVLSEARQIDWDRLKAEDPATFVQYSDAVNQRLKLIEQHRGESKSKQETTQQSQQQASRVCSNGSNTSANKIVEAMPELAREENFQRFATDNIGYLRETGFTPDEINDALDDRTLMLADKARRWDACNGPRRACPPRRSFPSRRSSQ
jgi:hypothetical protein